MQDQFSLNESKKETGFFQNMAQKYLPYWPLFAILLVTAIALSWLYIRYTLPKYNASATILVKDEKKGIDGSSIVQSLDLFEGKKIVENEIEVLKTRVIAKEVVKRLALYAPIFVDGRVNDVSGYLSSPVRIYSQNLDSISPAEKVEFAVAGDFVVIGTQRFKVGETSKTPYGDLKFVKNPHFNPMRANKEDKYYFNLVPLRIATADLTAHLDVTSSSKQSSVINLNFVDHVPQRAEDILRELIIAYNEASVRDKNQLAANTLDFIDERLGLVLHGLDSVEGTMAKFRTANKLVNISAQGEQYLANVGAVDQKITDANMQLAVLNQVQNYVVSKEKNGGIVPATLGISDPILSQLLESLYQSELQYEQLKQTTGENNPVTVSVKQQIDKLRPSILENVMNQRNSLAAGKSQLTSVSNRFNSMLVSLPQKERDMLEITRQQSIKNGIYTFLLQKREETALSYASTVPDSRLIDLAESNFTPVSPNKKMVYIFGGLLALLAFFGAVNVKEAFNKSILFRSEIEALTTTPILGELMFDNNNKNIVVAEGTNSIIADQFRQIRTSLRYLGASSKVKKIMVTSSIPGEGKSFTTANLGVSLMLMGRKVVLLELDLRRPKLREQFNLPMSTGLSNYLVDAASEEEIITKIDGYANLDMITSGPIPPNPSELIANGRLAKLFEWLEERYDYIICDTSPVVPVADAYLVSPLCDATLFIVRHAVTPKKVIAKMDDNNRINELKNKAIIFNGVKNSKFTTYGYENYAYYDYHSFSENGNGTGKKRKSKTSSH